MVREKTIELSLMVVVNRCDIDPGARGWWVSVSIYWRIYRFRCVGGGGVQCSAAKDPDRNVYALSLRL